jgi:hypothetical protein
VNSSEICSYKCPLVVSGSNWSFIGSNLATVSLLSDFHGGWSKKSKFMNFWKNSKIGKIWKNLGFFSISDVSMMW